MPFQYQEIVIHLLLALRGERSSIELSKAMGYSYNQVKRWESGEKQLRWNEFIHYCSILNIPILQILRELFQYQNADPQEFLSFLYSSKFRFYQTKVLAKKLNRHVSAMRRYLRGDVSPDLEFVLAFMDLEPGILEKFLKMLAPQLVADLTAQSLKEVGSQNPSQGFDKIAPLSAAIHAWLRSESYKSLSTQQSQSEFLAQRVGCSVADVDQLLSHMLKNHTVELTADGKYVPIGKTIAVQDSGFWFERAAAEANSFQGITDCQIVAASNVTLEKINEILLQAESKIRTLLEENRGPSENVRVILLKAVGTDPSSSK
jgi:hypothetical protein